METTGSLATRPYSLPTDSWQGWRVGTPAADPTVEAYAPAVTNRRVLWEGVAIGVVVSAVLSLLFPPESFMAAAPVLVPGAVLVLAVLWWRTAFSQT